MRLPESRKFLLVGLTGGIATGKSTVAKIFETLGCVLIDADRLARDVVEPGEPAYLDIVQTFGPGVVAPDGTLDRAALANVVFADPAQRKRLESITHPRIRERLDTLLAELSARGFDGVVIFDAALMVETGNYRTMDRLVVVTAGRDAQVQRQRERDRATEEAALRRIASQMPLAEKVKVADYVIDNSGPREQTEAQVREVLAALLRDRRSLTDGR